MNTERKTTACRDMYGKTFEVPTDQLTFRPSVYGVIVQDGKVLLSKQWDGYDFPGGAIELGETIEEALVREVREETGVLVKQGPIVAAEHDFFKLPEREVYVSSILLFYACSVVSGTLGDTAFDEYEAGSLQPPEWINLQRVASLKFFNPIDSPALIARVAAL